MTSRDEKGWGRRPAAPLQELALADVSISIPAAQGSQGALSLGAQARGNTLHFFLCQLTSALAHQYPVLVTHTFLLSSFGSVEPGPKLCKRVLPGRQGRGGPLQLALTDGSISVLAAQFIDSACSERAETSSCEFDFLGCQFASGPADQHPVVVSHHFFSFSHFGSAKRAHPLQKECLRAAR